MIVIYPSPQPLKAELELIQPIIELPRLDGIFKGRTHKVKIMGELQNG